MYDNQGNTFFNSRKVLRKIMISCEDFYSILQEKELTFFTGVPDSLLKDFGSYLYDRSNNIIAANEGTAVGIAIGYYLSTKKPAVVYLQNAGLGNTVNPLISLAHPQIYSIPILLLIGWRGEPGTKDEPQHMAQGAVTLKMLENLNIGYSILPDSPSQAKELVSKAKNYLDTKKSPYALVIKKGTFNPYTQLLTHSYISDLTRQYALEIVAPYLKDRYCIVATTGYLSRELYELREINALDHSHDFLTVGGMGHASSIALGIALQRPEIQVFCFDGDGAALMHSGNLSTIGSLSPKNFRHIIFNNFSHDSVGGLPTASNHINFEMIGKANNYKFIYTVSNKKELEDNFSSFLESIGPSLLVINLKTGTRKDLGRPKTPPAHNKDQFMEYLNNGPN